MPFYEYECSACKYYVEALQKISDPPMVKCPSCGKQTLQRLLSAPVFRLKGSGWYETDFKSEKEHKRNLASESEAAPEKDKKETEESSKPAVRPRKKSPATAKTAPPSGGKQVKSSGKSAVRPSAKRAAAKPVKKLAKRKAAAKPTPLKRAAKKVAGSKKSVKKLSKRRSVAKKK